MVLLWSDRVGEVKEVVETVGGWCSLFEKVLPWSPELVTKHRAAWLRCYGVPLHAWGADLFRALAFKFGRFIEVDENTLKFKRCDVARVKILTAQKQTIDSSMAVKVLGTRFEIRIIEELGDVDQSGGSRVPRGCEVWQDDEASKASGDGDSFQAVVAGFSETGSDADVSESCQVLLELETHERSSFATTGGIKELEYLAGEKADSDPNNLGKIICVTEDIVNSDGDKGNEAGVESAELVCRVEGVQTSVVGGTQVVEVACGEVLGWCCGPGTWGGWADPGYNQISIR
jgi:hypothetical protein